MHTTKEVRVTLIAVMNVTISNSMDGMGLFKDSFKDLNTTCSTVGLFK